jgi:hypothetical protein
LKSATCDPRWWTGQRNAYGQCCSLPSLFNGKGGPADFMEATRYALPTADQGDAESSQLWNGSRMTVCTEKRSW